MSRTGSDFEIDGEGAAYFVLSNDYILTIPNEVNAADYYSWQRTSVSFVTIMYMSKDWIEAHSQISEGIKSRPVCFPQ